MKSAILREFWSLFSGCGPVNYVHLAKAGHGFITFEDEDSATKGKKNFILTKFREIT